jgi:hypothetical protein
MKMIKTLAVVCAFCASSAYAVDPQKTDMTCAQLKGEYEPTAEAQARFAELEGSCDGVYTVDGALYVRSQAVIRRISGRTATLYLPATDHTFNVSPDPNGVVWVGGQKMRMRDMKRGDRIGIYLSVDKLATAKVDTISFGTEDEAVEEVVEVPVEEVVALPTTG